MEQIYFYLMLVTIPLYLISLALYAVRVCKGPTIQDSVLAVASITFASAILVLMLAVLFKSVMLVPGALILVLWAFALDLYVAKYLTTKEK